MSRLMVGGWVLTFVLAGVSAMAQNKLDCPGDLSEPDADFDGELQVLFENLEPFLGPLPLDSTDLDVSGIPDQAELALLVTYLKGMGRDAPLTVEAICQFEANKALWLTDGLLADFENVFGASPNAIAALMSMSPAMNTVFQTLGATETYPVIHWPGEEGEPPPFSINGDLDRDGLTNMEEWANVISSDRRVEDYIQAAAYPGLDGSNTLPLISDAGLALLIALLGMAGLRLFRRRAV